MRAIVPVLVALSIGGCTVAPPSPVSDLRGQAELSRLIAGKVPGAPQRCLSPYHSDDVMTLGANTIAYRDGSTVWLSHMQGSCPSIGMGYTLVTRQYGGAGVCAGDPAEIMDSASGMVVGACFFGDFVPYRPIP